MRQQSKPSFQQGIALLRTRPGTKAWWICMKAASRPTMASKLSILVGDVMYLCTIRFATLLSHHAVLATRVLHFDAQP
ncbi:hypothetical protein ASC97_21930 [Rhizobium sp. Root1203]|jgi:hypothetical protein|nr:hypothetical protein ASC97_21930 [Rhizobium sp. Root1203]